MATVSGQFRGKRRALRTGARGLDEVLEAWERTGLARHIVRSVEIPGREGDAAPLPASVPAPVRTALEARGIRTLHAHQAEAYDLARGGRDVVVATPTASGKSLCYNLPVLEALAKDPAARALYLFPTKALSRDQEAALRALLADAHLPHGAVTYDGDTPGDARRAARDRSGIIVTNPDMLHAGILPHHAAWARLFGNLRYVVIDELHMYRGVFGSHLANVIRRLDRVARFHGSRPVFILSSATIGNPGEHAARLVGREVAVVDRNGAPHGPRRLLVVNPPVVNAELGIRQSYVKVAVRVTGDLVRAGVSTLVFGQSRNTVEVMLKYLRDRLVSDHVDPETIHAYRGGYLPETRRAIEAGLREGQIRCVVATNALELGIDVGSLDAVVCASYPGTVSGLWQRFGRAGRRKERSLAVLVTSSAPLDQFVAREPEYLTGAPIEEARIDPDNVEILLQHLRCAAFELPFAEGAPFGNVPEEALCDALSFLGDHQVVHPSPGPSGNTVWHWATDAYPANHVSLRSVSWDNFVIIDVEADRTLAEMDWRSVHTMLHEQAIYQHGGDQFQVERLDYENHKAFVRKVAPDYYTTAMTHTRVSILDQEETAEMELAGPHLPVSGLGDVSVVSKVVGYKKIKFHTHENVGYGEVHLPEIEMHTSAFWLTFPEDFVTGLGHARPAVIDAIRGIMGAMHTVASVGLMIDPRDLGRTLGSRTDAGAPPQKGGGEGPGFDPTIFLYDHIAGGIGLAPRLFDEREALLRRTRCLIAGCDCGDGCPACIGPDAGEPVPVGRKALVIQILNTLGVVSVH